MDISKHYNKKEIWAHFEKDLELINRTVAKGQSLAITGLPKTGINRLMHLSYCNYKGAKQWYKEDYFNKKLIDLSDNLLVFIPHGYLFKTEDFLDLERLLIVGKQKVQIVLHLDYRQIERVESELSHSKDLLMNIHVKQLCSLNDFRSFYKQLKLVKKVEVPVKLHKKIWELSGGNIGLAKRIIEIYSQEDSISYKVLQKDIALGIILTHIKASVEGLSKEAKTELGFYKNNKLFTPLIIDDQEIINSLSLKQLRVFKLLKNNEGKLVTKDEIDKALTEDKYSFWGNYKAVSRLRESIKSKYRIEAVKGKGYILVRI